MKARILACALALALLLTAGASAERLLTWNELNDEAYGATVGAHVFAETLEQLSGGELKLDLYINGELGSERESMQGLQMGTLDFFRGNASSLPGYGAELIGATGMPYVFASMEQFDAFSESPLGQELLASVEEADCGYVALAWMVEGPRSLFITEEAYRRVGEPDEVTLETIGGLNFRDVPGNPLITETLHALGTVTTPINYSELYTSLKAGIIDGAENGVTSYMSARFNEVAPYFIADAHIFGCGVVLVSRDTWDSLNAGEQEWVRQAAQAASDACYAYNIKREQDCFDAFEQAGIKLLRVADMERWQEACAPVYDEQSEACQAVIRRIQNGEY